MSVMQLAAAATVTRSTNVHYFIFKALPVSVGLRKPCLTVWSCSSACAGNKEPTIARNAVAATFHLEDPIISVKVCRKIGDVSFCWAIPPSSWLYDRGSFQGCSRTHMA